MKLFKELGKMIHKFIKPYQIKEPILEMPKNVKKMGIKIEILALSLTIFSLTFAFVLKLTNMMIEQKLFLLGMIMYMLYRGQNILRDAFNIYSDSEYAKYNMIFEDELVLKGTNIIGATKDKVLKYDENSKIYRIMDNETILNTIKKIFRKPMETSNKTSIRYHRNNKYITNGSYCYYHKRCYTKQNLHNANFSLWNIIVSKFSIY